MLSNISNFNLSFNEEGCPIFEGKNEIKNQKIENIQKNLDDSESQETSQIMDQINPSFITERKKSNDSISICGSLAETTLSQNSESSIFLSFTNQNKSQINSTNENIEIEADKDIPFYYGYEKYYRRLMPEKFDEYKNSKNFLPKNSFTNNDESKCNINDNIAMNKNYEINQNQNKFQNNNCFYFPYYGVYCPINSFYFNHFSKVIINNYNNKKKDIKNKKKNDKVNKIYKKDKKDSEEIKKEEIKEVQIDEKVKNKIEPKKEQNEQELNKNEEQKETINTNTNKNKHSNHTNQKNNHKRNMNHENNNKNKNYNNYNKQRYNQNLNRNYNNCSNYYNSNEIYQEERNRYYYNNYYNRRYHNKFESKFSYYK